MPPNFKKKLEQAQNMSFANIQAKFSEAVALHQKGLLTDAQEIYEKILRSNPKHVDALHLLGVLSSQSNKHQLAADLIGKAIDISPNNAAFYSNRGIPLQQLKQLQAAVNSYDHAIRLKPDYAEAYFNRGLALKELKQFDAAVASYNMAISFNPQHAGAFANRGNALQDLTQFEAAIASYDQAINIKPDLAEAFSNRGNALKKLKQFDAAVASYAQAIRIKPDYAESHYNLGLALEETKAYEAALASHDRAISFNPGFAEAFCSRGNALKQLKEFRASLASYDQAIRLKPDYSEAYTNRGLVLQDLNELATAVESHTKSISINPDYAEAYSNRGTALFALKQFVAAINDFDTAIQIKPDFANAYFGRGTSLQELKQIEAAAESYAKALRINPDLNYGLGVLLHARMMLCDWDGIDIEIDKLIKEISIGKKSSASFPVLALTSSLSLQKKATKIMVDDENPSNSSLGNIEKLPRKNKIRIGYYSADFHRHATTYLMAELFERHDKNKFELIAFSFGPESIDEMRQRVSDAFDQFVDVRLKSNKEIAELSRSLGIDIAVDLKGLTYENKIGIFAFRAAPIQVHYIGFPGTLCTDYIDYLIADKVLIPEESKHHYSEKIIYLPNSYQVNDRQRVIAEKKSTKIEVGLPAEGFIFCCFNNSYKITPEVFDTWVKILRAVEGSALWLLEVNSTAEKNLKKEAENRGLDPKRLIFAKSLSVPLHLARHRLADLFLDTLPCNAHTTASDALWAGLPVLTCVGESFASRVAASLLSAVGLPELITQSQAQYEALAIDLGCHPEKLQALKTKLAINRLTTPLFDSALFTKHIESAYTQMYERYQNDLPPDTLYIE